MTPRLKRGQVIKWVVYGAMVGIYKSYFNLWDNVYLRFCHIRK